MSSMRLEVKAGKLQYSIPIERRITLIRGDSGKGKSTLVELVSSHVEGVKVDFPLEIVVATETTWKMVMQLSDSSLIIFDDMTVVESGEFAQLVKETEINNNYFLVIGRENVGLKGLSGLSYSIHSILRMVTDETGLIHYTQPFYMFKQNNGSRVKHVLIEDKGKGYKFFKEMLPSLDVQSASDGKSSIVRDSRNITLQDGEYLLIVVDTAAYGCHIEQLSNQVLRRYNAIIDISYECFEEFLLSTNIFKDNEFVGRVLAEPCNYANKYISWERFFEVLIKEITQGTPFKYSHRSGVLRQCYVLNCDDCNEHIQEKCEYKIAGDKFEVLLKETKNAKYLRLRE